MLLLVTGGCGFIGTNFIRLALGRDRETTVVNLDKVTYAGNPANLADAETRFGPGRYTFVHGDICDAALVRDVIGSRPFDAVVHFAAESHVDRSISDATPFVMTNVLGTQTLLDAARQAKTPRYVQVSTDEVYGSLGPEGAFSESTPLAPNSPYSASKAAADLLVRAAHETYGMDVVVTRCSNNYGPYQFPEKLIPLFINNIRRGKPLPVYGKGENVRDWLFVEDHARAIDLIFHRGKVADTYNIGGFNEWKNIDLIKVIIETVDRLLGNPKGCSEHLITYVADRQGHDMRYAIDSRKLQAELGWEPSLQFEEGIEKTVRWYLDHQEWMDDIVSGDYERYYGEMYANR